MTLRRSIPCVIIAAAATALLGSCGTGIDTTRRITAQDVSRHAPVATPEDTFMDDLAPQPFAAWRPGKQLYVVDDRLRLMLGATAPATDLRGDTLTYVGAADRVLPTGAEVTDLTFTTCRGADTVVYQMPRALSSISATERVEVPLTIEMSLIDSVRARLADRELWVLTPDRFTTEGSNLRSRKFVPVRIKSVGPGNTLYPVSVVMEETARPGQLSMVYMSVGPGSGTHRRFASLFSLTDPAQAYPHISRDAWQAIISNNVVPGMTREECRLAWGSPATADRRPTGGGYITEMWGYENGAYLIFEDGILTEYRR